VKILLWHVHGAWTTSFVHGRHTYFVPTLPDRGPDGRGRAQTYEWPENAVEITPDQARDEQFDVIILQRPEELESLAHEWLGRRPGRDIPAVYVEHNAPQGRVNELHHPAADHPELTLAHVTHFNSLFWDSGDTPTRVIEHGVVDPGYRYTGELDRCAVVINEARRRARVTGTDIILGFNGSLRYDLFGIDAAGIGQMQDLPQAELHREMARRRVYLHPIRWTSLGLSLIEAMHLGMPVVALATTAAPEAVPPAAGFVTTDPAVLRDRAEWLCREPDHARAIGAAARVHAKEHFGLQRFLDDWDRLLEEVA
jgi:glycosyltransferase involved in cell wall biosynthesis